MKSRVLCALAPAALSLTLASSASAGASPSSLTTAPSTTTAGQCSESYVPLGSYRTFRTYFFGKTVIRLRTSRPTSSASVQWWSGPTSAEQDLGPGASVDLNRSFAGLGIQFHPWGWSGIYVSFPYGPC